MTSHISGPDDAAPTDTHGAFSVDNHAALAATGSGALDGLRFAAKDVFDVAGKRTGFGQPQWLASHPPATRTAPVLARLLDAGARMCGRTITDELTYSLTGENVHYGTPVNPAAPDRIPGGSSNGSAVAVAAGMVDFSLGTDCGGSVRLPASYCGILGFRPTHGRVDLDGAIPFAPSFDTCGWFATDAEILQRVGAVILDGVAPAPLPALGKTPLLMARDAFEQCTSEVADALGPVCDTLVERFATRDDGVVSGEGLGTWRQCFQTIQAAEIWGNLGPWVSSRRPELGPGIRERFEAASRIDPRALEDAQQLHVLVRTHMEALLARGQVLCLPTAPRPAPRLNTPVDQVEIAFRNQAMALLCIAGLAGLPQVSLPVASVGGLPVGLSLIAGRGCDEQLLGAARQLCP